VTADEPGSPGDRGRAGDGDRDEDGDGDEDGDLGPGTDLNSDPDPDSEPAGVRTTEGRPCPHCGTAMVHRHCKYVCPGHGVVFDCSDPF